MSDAETVVTGSVTTRQVLVGDVVEYFRESKGAVQAEGLPDLALVTKVLECGAVDLVTVHGERLEVRHAGGPDQARPYWDFAPREAI